MSLQGKRIKDIWRQLVNIQLSITPSALKTGDGQELPIKVSPTEVEITGALKLSAVPRGSSSEALTVDSAGKIAKVQIPVFRPATATVVSGTAPGISLDNGLGQSSVIRFSGVDGIQAQASSSGGIVFSLSAITMNQISAATTLTAEDHKKIHVIDAAALAGGDIRLPPPQAGAVFKFIISVSSATAFNIVTNDEGASVQSNYFFGKAYVHKTGGTSGDAQIIDKATASATPASYDHFKVDKDSTTTGGHEGDVIEFYAIDGVAWLVSASLTTTQNVGTPTVITSA